MSILAQIVSKDKFPFQLPLPTIDTSAEKGSSPEKHSKDAAYIKRNERLAFGIC